MEYIEYTPDLIRAILSAWPDIEAARDKGILVLSPVPYRTSFEEKVASERARQMFPRPKRSSNRVYTIDDCAVVILDVDNAFNRLDRKTQKRLRLHYLYGYEYGEIAAMEGADVNEESLRRSCNRATEKMAEWLESPKEPKQEPALPERDLTYKRKYTSIPPTIFK